MKNYIYRKFFKRFFDFIFSLTALICLTPILLLVIVWLVFFNHNAGVFFVQNRPGKGEKIFKLIKFKSMNDKKDSFGNLLPDAERLTYVGQVIRNFSIDELPQLINILKGDMSFIGPRPLAVQYLPFYNEIEKHRHDIRPGLTGWAQVNGRKSITWEEKFKFDIEYVENYNFMFDIRIFFQTIIKVIKKADVNSVEISVDFNKWRLEQASKNKNEVI